MALEDEKRLAEDGYRYFPRVDQWEKTSAPTTIFVPGMGEGEYIKSSLVSVSEHLFTEHRYDRFVRLEGQMAREIGSGPLSRKMNVRIRCGRNSPAKAAYPFSFADWIIWNPLSRGKLLGQDFDFCDYQYLSRRTTGREHLFDGTYLSIGALSQYNACYLPNGALATLNVGGSGSSSLCFDFANKKIQDLDNRPLGDLAGGLESNTTLRFDEHDYLLKPSVQDVVVEIRKPASDRSLLTVTIPRRVNMQDIHTILTSPDSREWLRLREHILVKSEPSTGRGSGN